MLKNHFHPPRECQNEEFNELKEPRETLWDKAVGNIGIEQLKQKRKFDKIVSESR